MKHLMINTNIELLTPTNGGVDIKAYIITRKSLNDEHVKIKTCKSKCKEETTMDSHKQISSLSYTYINNVKTIHLHMHVFVSGKFSTKWQHTQKCTCIDMCVHLYALLICMHVCM